MYAGDDATDFAALSFAAQHGRAIFVASGERTPPAIPSLCVARSIPDLCWFFTCEMIDLGPAGVVELLGASGNTSLDQREPQDA